MRLGTFFASAGVLFAFGAVGFRTFDLEQRIAHLAGRLERLEARAAPPHPPNLARNEGVLARDYEARLSSIEHRVSVVESLKQGLSMPSHAIGEDRLKQEQAILSVVERENSRIREVQLEWHKARWLETRKQQLAAFAYSQKLDAGQTTNLYEAIESELNNLAEVMKRPAFVEEPDQAAADWLNVLAETDHRAQSILTPAQYQVWAQGRVFERKVLWPWLPDYPSQDAQQ